MFQIIDCKRYDDTIVKCSWNMANSCALIKLLLNPTLWSVVGLSYIILWVARLEVCYRKILVKTPAAWAS